MKVWKLFPSHFSFNYLVFTFLIMTIKFSKVCSQDFQYLTPKVLTNEDSLIDLKNYEDENIIMTKKEIFKGLNPQKIGEFTDGFPKYAKFATYNSDYILAACTDNAVLSFFNINDLREVPIYSYEES